MSSVAVIGSGTWGTAIAHLIAGKNVAVRMWTRSADVADAINAAHRNPRHLPDVELAGVTASASFEESLRGVDAAIFVCPSSYLRSIALSCAPFIASDLPVDIQTVQYPIYVFKGEKTETYNEIDYELYGMNNTEADCIRFILWALTDSTRIQQLQADYAHLEKVWEAAEKASAVLSNTEVEG